MRRSIVITVLLGLVFCSCSKQGTATSNSKYDFSYTSTMTGEAININYNFEYNFKDFDKASTKFNKSIALLSFVKSIKAAEKASIGNFYSSFGFDNIVYSEDFDKPEDKDSIRFTIAHLNGESYDLIGVTTNGVNYSKPWENNFILGLEGDADGFVVAANKVIAGIKTYLTNYTEKPVKLWITGYSRSAAISNIVSYRLIDDGTIEEKNMFSYTFEAPRAVSKTNTKEYKSIFNIINSADLVTHVAPDMYDLKRAGVDVDIYSSKIDNLLKKVDNRLRLSSFTSSSNYSNESELGEYLFNTLLGKSFESEEVKDMSTRENYVLYHQDKIAYLLSLFMTLKSKTTNDIMNKFSNISFTDIAQLLEEDGLYNFIKPVLDANNETYDDTKLKDATNDIVRYIKNNADIASFMIDANARNSLTRTVSCHYPEVNLVLLYNY